MTSTWFVFEIDLFQLIISRFECLRCLIMFIKIISYFLFMPFWAHPIVIDFNLRVAWHRFISGLTPPLHCCTILCSWARFLFVVGVKMFQNQTHNKHIGVSYVLGFCCENHQQTIGVIHSLICACESNLQTVVLIVFFECALWKS